MHFLTKDQTGTSLTGEITGQLSTRLTDKFSMWIWSNDGKVPSYEKLNDKKFRSKYCNLVHQIRCRLNTDKQINRTSIQYERMACKNWTNSTKYNDIKALFPTKGITTRKSVKHEQNSAQTQTCYWNCWIILSRCVASKLGKVKNIKL